MAIFTFRLSTLFLVIFCFCGSVSFAATINSIRTGNWNDLNTWSTGTVPTAADDVFIQSGEFVTITANAVCGSLNINENLSIQSTYNLIITGDATLDQSILDVNSGYLYVGGLLNVIGNGNANKGILFVSTGSVIVVGSIYFWKDQIGTTNGSTIYRLLEISSTGTIDLGGMLVGPNGTDAATLARTTPLSYIFKGGFNTNYWNDSRNWEEGAVPTAADPVIIPLNITANLQLDQAVRQINMAPGSLIDLGVKTLTLWANLNNIGGNFSGTGILKFDGIGIDQTYTGYLPTTVANIEINKTGKTLFLNGPFQVSGLVNVTGGTVNSNGNLTLLSTATKNANVGPLLSGAQITGNVIVQSWMKGGTRGFQSLTSPVYDGTKGTIKTYSLKVFQTDMLVTGPNGVLGASSGFTPPVNNFDKGLTQTISSSTVKLYNEPAASSALQYIYPAYITDTLSVGKGIYFYYRGDRNFHAQKTLSNSAYIPESFAPRFIGQINSGDITVPLSYTNTRFPLAADASDGYNMVGNPYPSIIDWNSPSIIKTNVSGATAGKPGKIYVLRKNGSFATYDGDLDMGTNGGTRYLLPGQGFFVKASGINGSLKFMESSKSVVSPSATPPGERLMSVGAPSAVSTRPVKHVRVFLKQDSTSSDETIIVFQQQSLPEATEEDATYFGGNKVMLTSLSTDSQYLSINRMPEIDTLREVRLYISAVVTGDYQLSVSDFNSLKGVDVLLVDKLKSDTINLKSVLSYSFVIDKKISDTYGSDRFKLLFEPIKILNNRDSLIEKMTVKVFPNPTVEELNITMNERPAVSIQLSIFNIQGKRLSRRIVNSQEVLKENVSNLKKGIYIVELKSATDNSLIGRYKFVVGI